MVLISSTKDGRIPKSAISLKLCRVYDKAGKPVLGFQLNENYFNMTQRLDQMQTQIQHLELEVLALQEKQETDRKIIVRAHKPGCR